MDATPLTVPQESTLRRLARRLWALRWRLACLAAGGVLAWLCRHLPAEVQAVCEALVQVLNAVGL